MEVVSRQDCYSIIENKLGTTDYHLVDFKMVPLDQGKGFLGSYYKLQIKIFRQSEETINCFVKSMPKNSSARGIVEETGCFFKEIFVYQTLVPLLRKYGIEMFEECLPKCYFQKTGDFIVFEDISMKNYRALPSQISFGFSLLTMVIKKLAKFHASSVIFEEKKSKELGCIYRLNEEFGNYLQEINFMKEATHRGALIMQTGVRSIPDVVNLFPELKTITNEANFVKIWPKLEQQFWEVIKPSRIYRNVLCHGDLWSNNIMIQFDGSKPTECCFVDYQCTRYCPPAHDCLSVVYLTTDRATRNQHVDQLISLYYEEFSKILADHGHKSEEILPFGEFMETINLFKPQMVMQSIMWFMFVICTSEEISSFLGNEETCRRVFFEDRKEYLRIMCEKSTIFRSKMRECVLDLHDLCNSWN